MHSNPTPKKKEEKTIDFNYPIIDSIELNRPSVIESVNFWDVIISRKSVRKFEELSLEEISKILWFSAKVKELVVQENGYVLTHRASASGGARHPIDIIVQSPILNSSKSFYYYNPFQHNLNKLALENHLIDQFIIHLNSMINIVKATIFWFVAHPDRTAAKYENPESIIWRDAGALIHSVQLACTGIDINSCAFGTLGEPFVSEMFAEYGQVVGVGGIAVG